MAAAIREGTGVGVGVGHLRSLAGGVAVGGRGEVAVGVGVGKPDGDFTGESSGEFNGDRFTGDFCPGSAATVFCGSFSKVLMNKDAERISNNSRGR